MTYDDPLKMPTSRVRRAGNKRCTGVEVKGVEIHRPNTTSPTHLEIRGECRKLFGPPTGENHVVAMVDEPSAERPGDPARSAHDQQRTRRDALHRAQRDWDAEGQPSTIPSLRPRAEENRPVGSTRFLTR